MFKGNLSIGESPSMHQTNRILKQTTPVDGERRLSNRRCRIVLYSHDTMGLGHIRRNLLIAQTLAHSTLNPTILLIAGARKLGSYDLPPDLDCVILPAYHKGEDGNYRARRLDVSGNELAKLRSNTIMALLSSFEPDIFIVDNVARGALGELEPTLKSLREGNHTRCVLGLRDIQDDRNVTCAQFRMDKQAIREYYDSVWIYGDPNIYDQANESDYSPDIRSKVSYTGYLDQRERLKYTAKNDQSDELEKLNLPPGRLVFCMVGGGQDGTRLAKAFVQSQFPLDCNAILLTGPDMPEDAKNFVTLHMQTNPRLRVIEFLSEPTILLKEADCVITMGGYNSVCEVLSFDKPALIVPRIKPRLEQWIRAECLNKKNFIDIMHPDDLTPLALSKWVQQNVQQRPRPAQVLNLNGLSAITDFAGNLARA